MAPKDLVAKYEAKRRALSSTAGPAFLLEPNPDGPLPSLEALKALQTNDTLQAHQGQRVWWVKQVQDNAQFAAMLEATDESLGRIRAKLGELGLAENTILIFTGDNGGMSASNQYRGGHTPERCSIAALPLPTCLCGEPRGGTTRGGSAYP